MAAIMAVIWAMNTAFPVSSALSGRAQGSPCARGPGIGDGLAVRFFVGDEITAGSGDVGLAGNPTPAAPDEAGAGVWMENDAGGAERARGVWSSPASGIPTVFVGVGTAPNMPGGIGGPICGPAAPVYVTASCAAPAAPAGDVARLAMASRLAT